MGLFNKFKKKAGAEDGAARVETIELAVGPDLRQVDDAGVRAIDDALSKIGSGELLHLLDPRRINAFSSGGPSTWSVAHVPVGEDHFFVTYGNSDRIDPARSSVEFELAIRVPASASGIWPGLLLRQMVRYMLQSGRELKVGDFMPFPAPLTRAAVAPPEREQFPLTEMNAVFLVPDPLLPTIETPRGAIEVRRVVGMFPDERELMEPWSVRGLAEVMARRSPALTTDIARTSFAAEPAFVDAMREGSKKEGSQFAFVAVPSVKWELLDKKYQITLPGGKDALRIHRMVEARLQHGMNLLIHDVDPDQRMAVALEPAETWELTAQGEVLVIRLPPNAPNLEALANGSPGSIVWRLS